MIPAAKSSWFSAWFVGQARSRITSRFGRVFVRGVAEARDEAANKPLLGILNHTTWWDALVVLWLSEHVLGLDGYAMMDAKNLKELPFFAKVGAFGVDLDDRLDGARAVRHAVKLLDRPGRAVWIFPEGEERSPHAPLVLRPGAAQVGRVAQGARLVPVGLRYVFGSEEDPDLYVSVGSALSPSRNVATGLVQQEEAIARELAVIDAALESGDTSGFTLLHGPRRSRVGRLATRMLALLFPLR